MLTGLCEGRGIGSGLLALKGGFGNRLGELGDLVTGALGVGGKGAAAR